MVKNYIATMLAVVPSVFDRLRCERATLCASSADAQYAVDLEGRILAVAADPNAIQPKKEMDLLLPQHLLATLVDTGFEGYCQLA
jgi:hypothetical protein